MSTVDPTQSSDDALFFMNSAANNVNLFDASEDPTGGKNAPNALPDFNHRAKRTGVGTSTRRQPTSLQPVRARGRQL